MGGEDVGVGSCVGVGLKNVEMDFCKGFCFLVMGVVVGFVDGEGGLAVSDDRGRGTLLWVCRSRLRGGVCVCGSMCGVEGEAMKRAVDCCKRQATAENVQGSSPLSYSVLSSPMQSRPRLT